MLSVEPKDLDPKETYQYLIGGISPRPIALVSTVSKSGANNLAPFSFFNAFGANPPVIGFSPARRARDGSQKDTYYNLMDTKECVVHIVNYDMVEQMNLSSTEYEKGIDEFIKSGLTAVGADIVQAKRVKESPFHMECKLIDMVHLGENGGAGNLALCEVIKFHIDERILKNTERGKRIDPHLLDAVARNGQAYYTRASGSAIFEVQRPINYQGIGYDALPEYIKSSKIYTANNLGAFANVEKIPTENDAQAFLETEEKKVQSADFFDANVKDLLSSKSLVPEVYQKYKAEKNYKLMFSVLLYMNPQQRPDNLSVELESIAQLALAKHDLEYAWGVAASAPILTKAQVLAAV